MKEFFKNIFEITATIVLVTLLSSVALITVTQIKKDSNQEEEEIESVEDGEQLTKSDNKLNYSKRRPASVLSDFTNKINQAPSPLSPEITSKNEANYNSVDNQSKYFSANQKDDGFPNSNYVSTLARGNNGGTFLDNNIADEIIKSETKKTAQSNDTLLVLPTNTLSDKNIVTNPNPVLNQESSNSSSSGGSTSSPAPLSCSTDILSGSFGNPIGVNIACNYLSSIKYCLAKDTCCDPKSTPTDFTTTIAIGTENGNFCLTYYGESETAGLSEVVQNNFTINRTLPNLTVGTPKIYYQTTELVGESFITSTDFGKVNHSAGQINFRTNDPTPTGLNYSCQEIAENDHLSLIPIPSTTLSLFDVEGLLPSNEIKIPFREDKLEYGLNYFSSYIKNNTYIIPLYSCSTSPLTLEDFSYFETSMSQASVGDNNLREFEGQFTSFGFFEEDLQVFRGPAGESINEKSGTSLESGLLSIFY